MKRINLLTAGLLLLANFSFAQNEYLTGYTKFINPSGRTLLLERNDEDSWLTFHDPGQHWYSFGIDRSNSGALSINSGGSLTSSQFVMKSNGYVALGHNNPQSQLIVGSSFGASISGSTGGNAVFGTNLAIQQGGSNHNKLYTPYGHSNNYGYAGIHARWGHIHFYSSDGNTTGGAIVTPTTRMLIKSNGNIGIGTTDPKSKLAVNGQIRATEVKVLADISVPDYVFAPDYDLRSLKDTKKYIEENSHLPEIPSAAEIGENGIDLGDMNMRLLKKIEELTLHQIDLLEKLEQQHKQLAAQQERIKRLEEKSDN